MSTTEYTVTLDRFQGPMDLLLHLIRRAELDVTEIALSEIADQYLAHTANIEDVDVEEAGEFLVVASTLIEIKSRLLNPDETAASLSGANRRSGEELDPATELLGQLLAYKAYRDAGNTLESRYDDWTRRFPAGKAATDRKALRDAIAPEEVELEDINAFDLVQAFERILETVIFDRLGEHTVEDDDTPIELHAEDLVDVLRRDTSMDLTSGKPRTMTLRTLLRNRRKAEAVGLFLALLELIKQRAVVVRQVHDEATGWDDFSLELEGWARELDGPVDLGASPHIEDSIEPTDATDADS